MLGTSARLLRLLSLLQARADWTGAELAERLEVSPRTVRYDIGKLRSLGYPVHAAPGVAGGYRLGAGAKLPPLLLDDEEAVAVAVALRTAGAFEETALRALVKLEQVLPARLRHRVQALHRHTVSLRPPGTPVATGTLTAVAAACRDRHRLRFDYRTHTGDGRVCDVEPYKLVHTGRRWYLIAWDVHRAGWRTFRVDRMTVRTPHGPRFTPRAAPPADVVPQGVDTALMRHRATVTVHAPVAAVRALLPPSVAVEPRGDHACAVHAGGDTPMRLALHILMLDADFHVDGPPELLAAFRTLSERAGRASLPPVTRNDYGRSRGVTASQQGGNHDQNAPQDGH